MSSESGDARNSEAENTAAFATISPITIEFAKHVGDALSEMVDDKELQDHYEFYM